MYLGSNDPSYMNHIICGHYNVNYRCGKCLNKVFTTGQPLKVHMKVCKGLPKEAQTRLPLGMWTAPTPHWKIRSICPKILYLTHSCLLLRVLRKAPRQVCTRVSIPKRSPLQLLRSQTQSKGGGMLLPPQTLQHRQIWQEVQHGQTQPKKVLQEVWQEVQQET